MNVSQADTAKVEREVNIALHMRCHLKFPERFRFLKERSPLVGRLPSQSPRR